MKTYSKKIGSIKFGVLSPEQIRSLSQTRIVTPDTYDEDGYPIEGGLMDLHLGVVNPGLRCKTCGGRMGTCPGHLGHIELVRPVTHVSYAKTIYNLLRSTCKHCNKILLSDEKLKELDTQRDIVRKAKNRSKCPHCDEKQPKIKLDRPTNFYENDQRILPSKIRERMEKIPDEVLEQFGIDPEYARPEWAILSVLPVPPANSRPSITLQSGARSEDDLTHKLVDILRINQRLRDNLSAGAPQLIIEDLWDLLQYHVSTYFDNEISGIPPARHRSGRPLKTLKQRLKGKEGRFRYNLSGKRVNFSARTVITPDPQISINEVGVPEAIAEELTTPIHVTKWNIENLKKYIEREEPPKAEYVKKPDGRRKKVTPETKEAILEELEPGYVVERQLEDGDIIVFNRQPSLHRISMMAHNVKVLPGKTLRLNPCVCPPYNADFDGDEMNLHLPQTEEAKAEARNLMLVQDQMISPRYGRPIIVGNQDFVSAGYEVTKKGATFKKTIAEKMLAAADIYELPEPDAGDEYTGKLLFSQVLPDDLNLEYKATIYEEGVNEDEDGTVVIEDGLLKQGVIDKASFQGDLMDRIFRKYGSDRAREFLNKATRLVITGLMEKGFTVSFKDIELPEETEEEINEKIKEGKEKVNELIEKYEEGDLKRIPGKTREETLEARIMSELGKVRVESGELAKNSMEEGNYMLTMGRVGARGSILNITQMSALLGQQAVRGGRILRGYEDRALPHFERGDKGVESRGFVKSSFKDGLNSTEFFFHSMGGREGLVDKGIRTAKSGYMQRRLVHALQDINLKQDKTVRDAKDRIVQFTFGEDGVDPMKCIGYKPIDYKEVME